MILLTCGNEETVSHKIGPRLNETGGYQRKRERGKGKNKKGSFWWGWH